MSRATSTPRVQRLLDRLPAWAAPIAVGVAALGACTLVALVDPNQPGRYPLCPFLAVTGRWCPGCGVLRATHALLHGHPGVATGFNVYVVALFPYLAWRWLAWASPLLGGPALPRLELRGRAVWALLAGIVAFWVLRNLPVNPFDALAPTGTWAET